MLIFAFFAKIIKNFSVSYVIPSLCGVHTNNNNNNLAVNIFSGISKKNPQYFLIKS